MRARRPQGARQGRAVRRSLHAGDAVLEQPDATSRSTHIINAFRFELSRVQTPAVRERMVSGLMNVAPELAEAVAAGLGIREMPAPMPKVLQTRGHAGSDRRRRRCRCSRGPATAAFARAASRSSSPTAWTCPGRALAAAADAPSGAVPRFIGSRLGAAEAAGGDAIEIDATVEGMPRRCCSTRSCCPTAPRRCSARRRRACGRVREGSVPPLQADAGARPTRRAAREGRHQRHNCRPATPIRTDGLAHRRRRLHRRARQASPFRARNRSAARIGNV